METDHNNGNWRQDIKRLNFAYLKIIKTIGAISNEDPGHAQTVLGLDAEMIKLLMSLDEEAMGKVADVGVPLFRLKLKDLKSAKDLYKKGNGDRAASLLTTALAADNRGCEGEA